MPNSSYDIASVTQKEISLFSGGESRGLYTQECCFYAITHKVVFYEMAYLILIIPLQFLNATHRISVVVLDVLCMQLVADTKVSGEGDKTKVGYGVYHFTMLVIFKSLLNSQLGLITSPVI